MQSNSSLLLFSADNIWTNSFEDELNTFGYSIIGLKELVKHKFDVNNLIKTYNLKCIILTTKYTVSSTASQIASIRKYFSDYIPLIIVFPKCENIYYDDIVSLNVDDILFYPFSVELMVTRIRYRINMMEQIGVKSEQIIKRYQSGLKLITNHEFNTPMTAIVGFTELLRIAIHDLKKNEVISYISYIHTGAIRLMELIKRLRVWQDLERRTFLLEKSNSLIDAEFVCDIVRKFAKKYRREQDVLFEQVDFSLCKDAAAIDLIISELIDNAFKFSKPGTKVLFFIAPKEIIVKSTSYLHFVSQSDYKFYQFKRDKYEQQGLGLGISIAQLCCTAIGAQLTIRSENDFFIAKIYFND
jgi:hypothetical protein